jgi:hypothetical protein
MNAISLNDRDFLHHFEYGTLHEFSHRAHIRMAWLYLRMHEREEALQKIRAGLRHLTEAHDHSRKYHETLTVFWTKQIGLAMEQTPEIEDFEALIAQHPHLLNGKLAEAYYSRERLFSDEARQGWIEPDLRPME